MLLFIFEFELFEFEFVDASKSKTVPCYKVSWCDVLKSKRGGYKLYTKIRQYEHRCQNGIVQARDVFEFVRAGCICLNLNLNLVAFVCSNVKRSTMCQ